MNDVDRLVRGFARLMAWDEVIAAATSSNPSFVQDWQQANWEMFVEGAVREQPIFLEIYGEGADCNGGSSRVYRPDAMPTHQVVCFARDPAEPARDVLSGSAVDFGSDGLPLDELVTRNGTWYASTPPFDHVLIATPAPVLVVSLADVVFDLRRLPAPCGPWHPHSVHFAPRGRGRPVLVVTASST